MDPSRDGEYDGVTTLSAAAPATPRPTVQHYSVRLATPMYKVVLVGDTQSASNNNNTLRRRLEAARAAAAPWITNAQLVLTSFHQAESAFFPFFCLIS